MFKVLTGEKKRRVISPATITASVAAHLLVLGGVVHAAGGETTGPEPAKADTIVWEINGPPPPPPPPAPVEPPTPPPPRDEPVQPAAPVERLEIPQVTTVPDVLPPRDLPPVDPKLYTGPGPRGPAITPPAPGPTGPGAGTGPTGPGTEWVLDDSMVEERPVLDRNGLSRALERHYPSVLRDSRVGGRVVIEVIVDENGRPRPGSARVIEASHPAFGEAALRAVDRFRFTPARMMGTPVPVRVTIPIQWTAQ